MQGATLSGIMGELSIIAIFRGGPWNVNNSKKRSRSGPSVGHLPVPAPASKIYSMRNFLSDPAVPAVPAYRTSSVQRIVLEAEGFYRGPKKLRKIR